VQQKSNYSSTRSCIKIYFFNPILKHSHAIKPNIWCDVDIFCLRIDFLHPPPPPLFAVIQYTPAANYFVTRRRCRERCTFSMAREIIWYFVHIHSSTHRAAEAKWQKKSLVPNTIHLFGARHRLIFINPPRPNYFTEVQQFFAALRARFCILDLISNFLAHGGHAFY
jgi:hypothetical protein